MWRKIETFKAGSDHKELTALRVDVLVAAMAGFTAPTRSTTETDVAGYMGGNQLASALAVAWQPATAFG